MGMDVHGLRPKIRKNDVVDNTLNDGTYFRANVWGWRVIHILTDITLDMCNEKKCNPMGLHTKGWGNNDGKGLKKVRECLCLSYMLNEMVVGNFTDFGGHTDDTIIYLNLGMWTSNIPETLPIQLGGKDLVVYKHINTNDVTQEMKDMDGLIYFERDFIGKDYRPSHNITLGYFKEWVSFVNNSGGFRIC